MAKRRVTESNGREDWQSRQHTVELSFAEEEECFAWCAKHKDDLIDLIMETVQGGWKLSLSYSDYFGTNFASATSQNEHEAYHKHTFTVRYKHEVGALMILMWVLRDRAEKGNLLDLGARVGSGFLDSLF